MGKSSISKILCKRKREVFDWIRVHRTEAAILIIILLIGALLRFYRIGEYMTFLGDEGRDVIVVMVEIANYDLVFVGLAK